MICFICVVSVLTVFAYIISMRMCEFACVRVCGVARGLEPGFPLVRLATGAAASCLPVVGGLPRRAAQATAKDPEEGTLRRRPQRSTRWISLHSRSRPRTRKGSREPLHNC